MCRVPGYLISRPPPTPTQQKEFPIPLKEVSADVQIVDLCASVTIRQKFKNEESTPLEAVYRFALEENAAVSDFVAEIDGKKIRGTIKEKEEAKDTYDDAIAGGHGAYLLEQVSKNVFSVNVGNLPPDQEVAISITYVVELEFEEGKVKLVLPSSKAEEEQKYFSPSRKSSQTLPQLQLKVSLAMTSNIQAISSPSHPISFEFGEENNKAVVTLASQSQADAPKPFVLLTKLAKPHQPCVRVQKDSTGRKVGMLSLYPKLELNEDEDIFTEMIFVVDRSGSMSGGRINQVKNTMQIFLRSLSEGTMFNIVGFGSRTEFLFPTSVEYNDKNLEIATAHVTAMSANLGGTDILKPLEQIFKKEPLEGYPRQLFILTDGEVNNTQQCIDFVRKHANTTRVFTFGIGNEASQDLVKGMAKAGEGFYEFIVSGQAMEEKVMRQLSRAMQPSLSNMTIDWAQLKVAQGPFRLPPLFLGGRLVVYAFLQNGSETERGEVTLTAQSALKPWECKMSIDFGEADDGDLLHKLAAKTLIRDLEEGRSYMHNNEGGVIREKGDPTEETIRLSISYGILSKLTSFVAVEERDTPTEGTMVLREVGGDQKTPTPTPTPTPTMPKPGPIIRPACSICTPRRVQSTSSSSVSVSAGSPSSSARTTAKPKITIKPFKHCAAPAAPMSRARVASPGGGRRGAAFDLDKCQEKDEKRKEAAPRRKMSAGSAASVPAPPAPAASVAAPAFLSAPTSSSSSATASVSAASSSSLPQQMREIIMKQKANGSWAWTDVPSLCAINLDKLSKAIPTGSLEGDVDQEVELVWGTAVVAAFLTVTFADQQVNWDLVVKKAKKFIARQKKTIKTKQELDWFALALAFVTSNK